MYVGLGQHTPHLEHVRAVYSAQYGSDEYHGVSAHKLVIERTARGAAPERTAQCEGLRQRHFHRGKPTSSRTAT